MAETPENTTEAAPPKLARRKLNRKSTIKSGRTIGEYREHLETASERNDAHKKIKRRQFSRIFFTILSFTLAAAVLYLFGNLFFGSEEKPFAPVSVTVPYSPTIEVIDVDAGIKGDHLSSRMKEYIGQAEADFRDLGYQPTKAVIPSGAIREVDFYLDGYTGFIKLIIDRETGVSTEDADRMIRYLKEKEINDFAYIDVRTEGKAYYKELEASEE